MIIDTLNNYGSYTHLNSLFEAGFDFLKSNDLKEMPAGTYEISGKDCYAIVSEAKGKNPEDAVLEAHRKYIDIQYLVAGKEKIGWRPVDFCGLVLEEYNEEKDFMLFKDAPDFYINLRENYYTIFFPGDAHAPMISDGIVKKVVVKVRI
ncbi:MAG: YhcH/YjgK/YiaL family protein [Ignavibacteriaceae bacterium]|nr:YhcH/YjgK/YiaL family protein [Ignavibacteriaceae bacterium]